MGLHAFITKQHDFSKGLNSSGAICKPESGAGAQYEGAGIQYEDLEPIWRCWSPICRFRSHSGKRNKKERNGDFLEPWLAWRSGAEGPEGPERNGDMPATVPESRSGADFCSVFRCDGGICILDGTPEIWLQIFILNGSPSYWAEVQTELANCSGT